MAGYQIELSRRGLVTVVALALVSAFSAAPARAQPPVRDPLRAPGPTLPETATEPKGFFGEPILLQRVVLFGDRNLSGSGRSNGTYPEFGNLVPGAGWISVGAGHRHWFRRDSALVETSAAISWHGYKMFDARYEAVKLKKSRLLVGTQLRWQDSGQVSFFGEGPDSLKENESQYRLRSTNLIGFGTFRPAERVAVSATIGWLKPLVLERGGFFQGTLPDTRELFGGNVVFGVPSQPAFLHMEASFTADTRDFPGHPLRGSIYRAAVSHYSDRDAGLFSFSRYEAEAARFIRLGGSPIVVALRGWVVGSDTGEGGAVPFYLQPSLGGQNSLRSFANYRFRDRNLLLVNAETRLPMTTHVDAVVFVDAGSVSPRFSDLSLAKRSYGTGLRLHSRRQTFARLDLARGREGWRVLFRLDDPLSLPRLARRTASAPFVP
jgi:hypothetical protein